MAITARMAGLATLLLGWSGFARADGTQFPGTRPLGTGGAMRAMATGDAGPMLNPSGMSLVKAYIFDTSYQFRRDAGAHDVHLSAVDSTSGFNVGGGLFYTYHHADPGSGIKDSAHIMGGSLSFPFADMFYVGGTIKYLRLTTDAPAQETLTTKGVAFDVGLTLRAGQMMSLGLVGYNLNDPGTQLLAQALGGGLALSPIANLLLVADTVVSKVYDDSTRNQAVSFMGGGELEVVKNFALRLGGGRDGFHKTGYVSGGLSVIGDVGALDFSIRQDVSGSVKETFIGASGRLFVPSP